MSPLETENEELKKEILRLRAIMLNEGLKWMNHHKEHTKKAYWHNFMSGIIP